MDFKLEFGKTSDGSQILADEVSPDTCRFRDRETGKKLDKDRFRQDLGDAEGAYAEILKRVEICKLFMTCRKIYIACLVEMY